MNCPRCGYQEIPKNARFCPDCGRPVEIATRVNIRQDVGQNLGRVIGVQTKAIHGDVYGGDVYQVQVYALSDAGREASWRRFLDDQTPPYKFLSPYAARDRALFKGREVEVEQVIRRIGEQRLLVVYGAEGVGKTSLLAAGVIPELMQYGALVVHLHDYVRPLPAIREALAASVEQLSLALPAEESLPALLRAVSEVTQGSLVLILDQFERLFEPAIAADGRAALIGDLAQALHMVEPELLRLVLAVREEALGRLGAWQEQLPHLLHAPIQLGPLSREQAQAAIEGPLDELDHPVSFVGNLVAELLVPDLDELSPERPGQIQPEQLQIVCHWLYGAARERGTPLIDTDLYLYEAKGADGIMARYLTETLQTQLAGQRALAERILVAMASPGTETWVRLEQLPLNGASSEQVHTVLEGLVEAELLDRRAVEDRREYTFTSPGLAQEVRRLAGPEVDERYRAEDELERVWSAWLAREVLASRGQLRYLVEAGAHLSLPPVKLLLLLRSAVARDEPAGSWLELLRTDQGRALIRQLEDPSVETDWSSSRATLYKAGLLVGVERGIEGEGAGVGPVARVAVGHSDPVSRQTAALALMGLGRREALGRLEEALKAGLPGAGQRSRRAELRGALADVDPEVEGANAALPLSDRGSIWWWRARRRLFRGRLRILGLTVGGGLGAGLALGLLRALLGGLAHRLVGVQFAIYFYWAAILGGACALGLALAGPLRLRQLDADRGGTPPPVERAVGKDSFWSAVGLGTLCFGLAHVVVAWLNGLSMVRAPLVAPLGFLAGLGLSLALYGRPWVDREGLGRRLLRLGVAGLILVLTQGLFILAGDKGPGIAVAWSGSFYRAEFAAPPWWGPERYLYWYDGLALLDAFLVGVVLTIGLIAGLTLARRLLDRWQSLVYRAGD